MEENVKAYLAQILAYGINLEKLSNDELPIFVRSLIKWYERDVPDLYFTGDEDGVICQNEDDLLVSVTFHNNHLKFNVFDLDILDDRENSVLVAKVAIATVGLCQSYFNDLPESADPPVKYPEIQAGSEEEVITVKDEGFGIV